MFFDNPQDKLICVFGLGLSGLSTARYLQKLNKKFFVIDSRENPPGKEFLKEMSSCIFAHFGEVPQNKLNDALMIILSPGISKEINEIQLALNAGVKVVGDIEVFVNQTKKPIVAITGSNGKSTVTDLTNQLLCAAGVNSKIGGNFGLPVLDYLPEDSADIYVLELSSFQLDTTQSLSADVAVVLNITEDHMDRYSNFEQYRKSKLTIFDGAQCMIGSGDDKQIYENCDKNYKRFSLGNSLADYYVDEQKYLTLANTKIVSASELSLTGEHNWSNALVALAIMFELNIEVTDNVLNVLKAYKGLQHRFELVAFEQNIEWVNDSKATNVGATEAALAGINRECYSNIVLIAGGDAKGGDLSSLRTALSNNVSRLVLIGKDAKLFADLVNKDIVYFASDMKDAVKNAFNFIKTQPYDVKKSMVLLSPACASLDMYKNYEVRGQSFVEAINDVVAKNKECI
jgi:UDP-N-acetylmuramoylalanine--D-glutamate ligase